MGYILIVKQIDEGCDYSIACGVAYHNLKANTTKQALDESKKIIAESYSHPEYRLVLAKICLLEKEINVNSMYADIDAKKANDLRREEEKKDRAEFERLKAKFVK